MFIFYLIIMILALLSSWFILWHVPFLHKTINKNVSDKKLSIIIPARNEEENLPVLLNSLKKQNLKPLEILVVDNDSTDHTAEVAVHYGATVVHVPKSEEADWVGKSAGCWYGAKKAKGEYLLFLDADTFLPSIHSLENIFDHFQALESTGALSLQPYHVVNKSYENLSAIFNIIVLAGMNRFSVLKKRLEPAGAFGPSLMCKKETYFSIGGHKKVRHSILENVDFGKVFIENSLPVHLYGGKDVLHFRMYPAGLESLIQGWSKHFATGSLATHPLLLLGTSLWIAGAFFAFIFPIYFLTAGNGAALLISLIGYILFFIHTYRMARIAGNFHVRSLLFFPILFIGFVSIFIWSFIKTFFFREVSWKGRNIQT